MYTTLVQTIQLLDPALISEERKETLRPLIDYIREKKTEGLPTNLNFICTHNSEKPSGTGMGTGSRSIL